MVLVLMTVALIQVGAAGMVGVRAGFSDIETSRYNSISTGEWPWPGGGTIGFWGEWDSHNTYTEAEINAWLGIIDVDSQWLVPDKDGDGDIDVGDMDIIFEQTAPPYDNEHQFLGHYLATKLNMESVRLHPEATHDFGAYDPGDYLGLNGSGTLEEIVLAIESKYGTSPTDAQSEVMKDICDKLNNTEI